jgi:hypothetical protein
VELENQLEVLYEFGSRRWPAVWMSSPQGNATIFATFVQFSTDLDGNLPANNRGLAARVSIVNSPCVEEQNRTLD